MTPTPDDALQSPQESDSDSSAHASRPTRPGKTPLSGLSRFPYRRSGTSSLSDLYASTSSLPTLSSFDADAGSGTATPVNGTTTPGSVFSPGGTTNVRSPSPAPSGQSRTGAIRDLILRAFSPHVSVLASEDTEELVRHKGINGGLLELLKPFGEHVQGKVTIRDSIGVSRSWDDFAIRFVGVKDGLESPRATDRSSVDLPGGQKRTSNRNSLLEFKPARLRTGGDVAQVEDLVDRHLTFAEENSAPVDIDYITLKDAPKSDPNAPSPFYILYLRRLLSGLPVIPAETFSHPVASVIAISSRSTSPIEELRNLYDSSNTGEHRLPQWVHNEFLRYYVLIHDEDYDDITKSMALYDQMKRHFGLHCHLLRLRSVQCVSSDDDSVKLPSCEWNSAAEELAEIVRRETNEDDEDPTPCIFESDASALRTFVREMVTQSIVPSMERNSATWNDQVASRRRGLSGRFMSLSKRLTTFGNRNSSGPSLGGGNSNYDSLQGFYRPDAPEAIMRKLADYSMMLRDFKLAHSTFDILCQDFKNDKAWRHYAAANEMAAISSLLSIGNVSSKARIESVDQYLETAYYSYITRVGAPYYALRTSLLGIELLKMRGGYALDDSARWATKVLDDHLVGLVGHALVLERLATCFAESSPVVPITSLARANTAPVTTSLPTDPRRRRRRKAAFWATLAADAWLRLDKSSQAERCLADALAAYDHHLQHRRGRSNSVASKKGTPSATSLEFPEMASFLARLQDQVRHTRAGPQHIDGEALLRRKLHDDLTAAAATDDNHLDDNDGADTPEVEALQQDYADPDHHLAPRSPLHSRPARLSLSVDHPPAPALLPPTADTAALDPLGVARFTAPTVPTASTTTGLSALPPTAAVGEPASPVRERRADGFE